MRKSFFIAIIVCFAGLWHSGFSQGNTDHQKARLEQNKAIVRGYMEEVFNKGNIAAFDDYLTEATLFNNKPGIRQMVFGGMLQSMRKAFPDFHMTIEDQIAEGDKVVTRVTVTGTHQGEYRGIPATGKHIKYMGIAIDRIADGKVVEMWHQADTVSMLQQIGAMPSPEQAKKQE